jgi:translocation and assembly module TamA
MSRRVAAASSAPFLRHSWKRALALTLACASLPCLADRATAADAAGAAPAASPPVELRSADAIRYRVVVDAPRELVDTLTQSVDLVRWQSYADMTDDLLDRLARQAVDQTREAVATAGYFTPHVDIAVDRRTDPFTVTLKVEAGPPTRIAEVSIVVTGPAADDHGAGAAAIAELRSNWGLPKDAIFNQTAWENAKTRAVATLAASPYAAATLAASEARIDPDKQQADLSVDIASGPPFRIGRLDVTGLQRYDPSLVRNYSTLKRGELYSGAALDQYLRRLNGTGYFASVHAAIDTDPAQADDATVTVAVIEAPTRKLEAGVGYSTDTEFRVNASYRDVDINGRALQFYADARIETLLQSGALRFVQPPGESGWINSYLAKYEHTNLNNLDTRTGTLAARRASIDERNQWQYGVAYLDDMLSPEGAEQSSSHALYVDVERIWRRVDDLIAPTRGWILDLQGGAGIPGVSTRSFGRVVARFAAWYPPTRDWQLSGKLEGGAVFGASRQEVPSPLLFRTGGDTTVRGYAYESLGVKDGAATVPGRYYVVGSIEATRWINQTFGVAVFVDVGNAFDNVSDFHLALGYGVGARVRTPIGPFRFDVAYGQDSRQVRIHFSVGLAF